MDLALSKIVDFVGSAPHLYPMGMIISGRANSNALWVIELYIHLPGIFIRDRYIID